MRLIRYHDDYREPMLALHRSALVGIPLGMSQLEDEADLVAIEQVYLRGGEAERANAGLKRQPLQLA